MQKLHAGDRKEEDCDKVWVRQDDGSETGRDEFGDRATGAGKWLYVIDKVERERK